MKILISGAGIAGLTAAYWLKKYGFKPTIVERAPTLLTGGYKIDVRGSALDVLRRMGIYETVLVESTQMLGAVLVNKEGKVINEMSGDAFGHRVGDDVEIIRGALCKILMDQIKDVEFIFNDSIQEVSQCSNEVKVTFKNNKPQTFDLVIGADGIHSNTRRIVFGEENKFIKELGVYLSVFTVPNYLNLNRVEMQYSELGKIAAIWSAHGEPNMKACFGFTARPEEVDVNNKTQQEELMKKIYENVGWEVPQLLQMMSRSDDFYFDAAAQVYMDHWSSGRIVLVGDAAYSPSPMSGQGTSLALVGAYVLAGELAASKGNYRLAFDNYESGLRSYVTVNQQIGITAANVMHAKEKNSFFAFLFQQLMRTMPGFLIKFLIDLSTRRIKKAANSIILKDYQKYLNV